ncbi:MAG: hypothetical protein ACI4SP_01495 [Eubacteriales bacterium]
MKTDSTLKRATLQMTVGVSCFSLLAEVVYLILALTIPSLHYAWQFPVGNVFMAVIMVINFYLMGRGLYSAVESAQEDAAKRQIRFSHAGRSIMVLLALVACFVLGLPAGIAACITVAFPQLTVFCMHFFPHKDEETADGENAGDDTAPVEDTGEAADKSDTVSPEDNEEVQP